MVLYQYSKLLFNNKNIQKKYKINDQIHAHELRVIDELGSNMGIIKKEKAIELAKQDNKDLILITEEANPPVAKIVSYDKFRYQQEKENRRKNNSKRQELKRIQISARAAEHDLNTQIIKLEKFLEKGNRIEIVMRLRGRERYNKDWAKVKMERFLSMIKYEYKVTLPMKFGGHGLMMQITPKQP